MSALIKTSNLSKVYSGADGSTLEALKDINLAVDQKAFLTLIGPSGCGKSTLLYIIGGLLNPTTGDVLLDGRQISGPQPDRVAMVFQEASLYPWRTVLRNVEFGLEIRGVPKEERRSRALKYVELVGLSRFKDYFPSQLSGGMQQRVNLARALALEVEVLLMDEPFGALDEQTRLVLGAELTRIWQKTGKTIIFVTHSLIEAAYLSNQIAVMSARPGTIKEMIKVDVPRPRELDAPELVEVRRRIWAHIAEEATRQLH